MLFSQILSHIIIHGYNIDTLCNYDDTLQVCTSNYDNTLQVCTSNYDNTLQVCTSNYDNRYAQEQHPTYACITTGLIIHTHLNNTYISATLNVANSQNSEYTHVRTQLHVHV